MTEKQSRRRRAGRLTLAHVRGSGRRPAEAYASRSWAGRGARRVFLLIVPPLYGTDTTAEAVTIYEAGLGRKVIGRDRGANVDVWEFQ